MFQLFSELLWIYHVTHLSQVMFDVFYLSIVVLGISVTFELQKGTGIMMFKISQIYHFANYILCVTLTL